MPNIAYKIPATGKSRKNHIILIESSGDIPSSATSKLFQAADTPLSEIEFGKLQKQSPKMTLEKTPAMTFSPTKELLSPGVEFTIYPTTPSKAKLEKTAISMEQELRPLAAVAETIRGALVAANHPGKIEIEFGVELGGSAGIPLVTSGTAKANFKVTLTWDNQRAADK
jgi:hypothetical protein